LKLIIVVGFSITTQGSEFPADVVRGNLTWDKTENHHNRGKNNALGISQLLVAIAKRGL